MIGVEYSFLLISGLNLDIVETPVDIQFCKVSHFLKLWDELWDKRKWILVLDCYYIKALIILY